VSENWFFYHQPPAATNTAATLKTAGDGHAKVNMPLHYSFSTFALSICIPSGFGLK
jgi:hypothetical protein